MKMKKGLYKVYIRLKSLYIVAVNANEGTIVEDKSTLEERFANDEFGNESVTISGNSKIFFDNLLRKMNVAPVTELLPEIVVNPISSQKRTKTLSKKELDDVSSVKTEPNKDKKQIDVIIETIAPENNYPLKTDTKDRILST